MRRAILIWVSSDVRIKRNGLLQGFLLGACTDVSAPMDLAMLMQLLDDAGSCLLVRLTQRLNFKAAFEGLYVFFDTDHLTTSSSPLQLLAHYVTHWIELNGTVTELCEGLNGWMMTKSSYCAYCIAASAIVTHYHNTVAYRWLGAAEVCQIIRIYGRRRLTLALTCGPLLMLYGYWYSIPFKGLKLDDSGRVGSHY